MTLSQSFLPEFEHEMATTRKVLERLPNDKWGFKPHPKSMTLGGLATHISEMLNWTATTVAEPGYDIPADYKPEERPDRETVLAYFDAQLAASRKAIENCTDAGWMETWTLTFGGKPMFSMPRVAVYRGMCMNHIVHHRGQLSVYIRMLDVPVPSIYGPSADEGQM